MICEAKIVRRTPLALLSAVGCCVTRTLAANILDVWLSSTMYLNLGLNLFHSCSVNFGLTSKVSSSPFLLISHIFIAVTDVQAFVLLFFPQLQTCHKDHFNLGWGRASEIQINVLSPKKMPFFLLPPKQVAGKVFLPSEKMSTSIFRKWEVHHLFFFLLLFQNERSSSKLGVDNIFEVGRECFSATCLPPKKEIYHCRKFSRPFSKKCFHVPQGECWATIMLFEVWWNVMKCNVKITLYTRLIMYCDLIKMLL